VRFSSSYSHRTAASLRVPEQPERALLAGGGVVLFGGGVGMGWWVRGDANAMQSWNRRSGEDKKRKWVGGRQGKDYEEGCVTGMAKDFANGVALFCLFFSSPPDMIGEPRADYRLVLDLYVICYKI